MSDKSIYSTIIQAKNGTFIPVFISNKTVESRYNPENSCEMILTPVTKPAFFLVTGIASGILIKKLSEKFPSSKIIAFEYTSADIDFLLQIETVKELSNNPNVVFCSLKNLSETIIKNYLPALYGDFQVIQQKPWISECQELSNTIPDIINFSLNKIKADYSVQSHFGKRWQKNIQSNLKLINDFEFSNPKFDTTKTAAIIAAGPSLDKTIEELKSNRNEYVIFATDTAFSVLVKNKIFPEAVISIDGQLLSYNHFLSKSPESHFYFDMCGNSSALKQVFKHNKNIHLFVSGHPFCNIVNSFTNNSFPYIYTGSGTVTISALDLALKSGFNQLKIFGADFAYLNGKSYTKGTYLDSLYSKNANRIRSLETTFDKLIFRVPLKNISSNSYTTEVLESYKSSLEDYLTQNNCEFCKQNDIYVIKSSQNFSMTEKQMIFNYSNFIKYYNSLSDNDLQLSLLPLIAALRKNKSDESYENLLKLARSIVVSYN